MPRPNANRRQLSVSNLDRVQSATLEALLRLALPCLTLLSIAGCSGDPPERKSDREDSQSLKVLESRPEDTEPSTETLARFVSHSADIGLDFTYRNGEEARQYSILESLGGGVALFDADGDGDLDVFVPGGGKFTPDGQLEGLPGGFFLNDGSAHFENATTSAGLDQSGKYSHGAAVADVDNDGDLDLLVTGFGGLHLYQNQGSATFQDVTSTSGLTDTQWSSSAAFGDVNHDGYPDLYVAHYVDWSPENNPICGGPTSESRDICPPKRFQGLTDTLYLNNQDGTFRDVTSESGLLPGGKGLGVLMADVDLDGHLDIYVGNDTVANFLYHNDGQGHFRDVASTSSTAFGNRGVADGSMGVDVGDYNLDGRPDLFVANYEAESFALYRNEGPLLFRHVSDSSGINTVGAEFVGWGTVFFDFDSDGDEDIFVSNGHVILRPINAPLKQKPLLFQNQPGSRPTARRMVNVAPLAGEYLQSAHMGRGVARGDLDNDGDIDLVVSRTNEPVVVLINESTSDHHWVSLDLRGTQSGTDAVGVRVTVHSGSGTQTKQRTGGSSYASHHDSRLHFGLGTDSQIERVDIHWPSGTLQTLDQLPIDQITEIIEPAP